MLNIARTFAKLAIVPTATAGALVATTNLIYRHQSTNVLEATALYGEIVLFYTVVGTFGASIAGMILDCMSTREQQRCIAESLELGMRQVHNEMARDISNLVRLMKFTLFGNNNIALAEVYVHTNGSNTTIEAETDPANGGSNFNNDSSDNADSIARSA